MSRSRFLSREDWSTSWSLSTVSSAVNNTCVLCQKVFGPLTISIWLQVYKTQAREDTKRYIVKPRLEDLLSTMTCPSPVDWRSLQSALLHAVSHVMRLFWRRVLMKRSRTSPYKHWMARAVVIDDPRPSIACTEVEKTPF